MSDHEERIQQLEATMERLTQQVRRLTINLETLGVEVPPMESNPRKHLSPSMLSQRRRQLAAGARASKPVGRGRGAVQSQRTKAKLEEQARKINKGRKKGSAK